MTTPLHADPLGTDPPGTDPPGTGALGKGSLGTDPLGTGPRRDPPQVGPPRGGPPAARPGDRPSARRLGPDEAAQLSGAYALDALGPEERLLLEAAHDDSPELAREVAGLLMVAACLALAVAPVHPSPRLRATLLDALPARDDAPSV